MTDPKRDQRSRSVLIALTIGWIILFSYLLLASDPPDVGPIRLRSFENAGHVLGSLLLGFLMVLVLTRWTSRFGLAAFLSLATTFAFLLALEFIQELRPGRGYQRIDIQLNLIGTAAGVALAWATILVLARFRDRRRESPIVKSERSP